MNDQRQGRGDSEADTVPLFGTWRRAYIVVVAVFVVEVALFYAMSRNFA